MLIAPTRLEMAITSNTLYAAKNDTKIGDKVVMFREKLFAKWIGPFVVLKNDEKILSLGSQNRTWIASIDKAKNCQKQDSKVQKSGASGDAAREEKDYFQRLDKMFEIRRASDNNFERVRW